ncbi:MAG: TIGR00730 family Rossman fold protein [Oligoflexia bacterium]|nr:TIGR00730 family Rossman fold protein [Oligoflexia bacterium]
MNFLENPSNNAFMSNKKTQEEVFYRYQSSRLTEFLRVVRISFEFIRGFRALHFLGPCITVFGSARFTPEHPMCKFAENLSAHLVRKGFAIMTGGGPGIMQAANKGAYEAGGVSIGCNIELPREQKANPYLTKIITFAHFFVRKVMLVKYSSAYVIFPGGFGTLDELAEALTLVQTGKHPKFPIVMIGKSYWKDLEAWMKIAEKEGTIAAEDLQLLYWTDDLEEAISWICQGACITKWPKKRIHLN